VIHLDFEHFDRFHGANKISAKEVSKKDEMQQQNNKGQA
jgi:hypothetical protein